MDLYKKISEKVYIIAEMSANHAGNLQTAKDIIYAAKESGADCIKIQTYTADTLTIDCTNDYFRLKGGSWKGENLYQLYKKAYTPWEWQEELKKEAEKVEIDFFSTPFDKSSVDFLEHIGVEFYKIASFELVDIPFIQYVASKGKPIIISTGMATLGEIEDAVAAVKKNGKSQLALLKCTSGYPAAVEDMNLKTIRNMKEIFKVPVGLSDHSMGYIADVTAVVLGARLLEKHFCLSRELKTPDSSFSTEPAEFKQMVQAIREAEKMIGDIVYHPTDSEKNDIMSRKSIFVIKDIDEGEKITSENVRVIRPGYGLKPKYYEEVIGQKAVRSLKMGTPLNFKDIAGV